MRLVVEMRREVVTFWREWMSLIFEGEGVSLDFKKTITSCEKIARTMVSFANNKGGRLLIGVADATDLVAFALGIFVPAEDEAQARLLRTETAPTETELAMEMEENAFPKTLAEAEAEVRNARS